MTIRHTESGKLVLRGQADDRWGWQKCYAETITVTHPAAEGKASAQRLQEQNFNWAKGKEERCFVGWPMPRTKEAANANRPGPSQAPRGQAPAELSWVFSNGVVMRGAVLESMRRMLEGGGLAGGI